MSVPVHIQQNKVDRHINIYLLFIPIIVFVLTLTAILFSFERKRSVASNQEPAVLGEEAKPANKK